MNSPEERMNQREHRVSPVQVRMVKGNHRALTFTASTADVARDGDIIDPDGWQVANYLRNPVFLWSHNPEIPPIGKGLAVRIADTLEIDVEFDTDEFADRIFGLYERGFLNAVSVGFRPLAYRQPDEEERGTLGLPAHGVVWTKTELYELSGVSVPADPGALGHGITDADRAALTVVRGFANDEDRPKFDRLIAIPDETDEDIPTIADLADEVRDLKAAVDWLTDRQRAAELAPETVCPDVPPERSLSPFEEKLDRLLKEKL